MNNRDFSTFSKPSHIYLFEKSDGLLTFLVRAKDREEDIPIAIISSCLFNFVMIIAITQNWAAIIVFLQ